MTPRVSAAALLVVAAACVPASEPLPPAGAVGFRTDPSPASRGEPFVTDDGWTVRLETLALQATVNANPVTTGNFSNFRSETFLWNGAAAVDIYASGVPLGEATLSVELQERYIRDGSGDVHDLGVASDVAARFDHATETADPKYPYDVYRGPSVVVVARGEREGRIVTVDLAISVPPVRRVDANDTIPSVLVRADSLATVPLSIRGEHIFETGTFGSGGPTRFAPFAMADERGNADGIASAEELRAIVVDIPCSSCVSGCHVCFDDHDMTTTNLFDFVRNAVQSILDPR